MKRISYVVLLIVFTACLSACASKTEEIEEPPVVEVEETIEEPGITDAAILTTVKNTEKSVNEEAVALYREGCDAIKAGNFEKAETLFWKALELDGEYIDALDNLGITLRRLGKTDEAIQILKKSISLNPYNRVPYNSLCIAYIDKVDYKNALQTCKDEIVKIPDDGEAYYNEGAIYMKMSEYKSASPAYKKAIMLFQGKDESRMYDAIYSLGFCFYALKDWDNAIAYMEMALDYFPDDKDLMDFIASAKDWKEISY